MIESVVTAINRRPVSVDELTGAAEALLEAATPFPRPMYPFADIVGTGGDGHNTINLSTIAAITAAACGCRIVKHGNRSVSSCSGSFDLLESLGVPFDLSPEASRRQVDRHDVCVLFAPRYHAGLRHAAAVRAKLKVRTIFNLLGPLVNPARPPLMLLGVARPDLLETMAGALQRLGCDRALVVHGSGVDEVAVHGPTQVVELDGGQMREYDLAPSDFGSATYPLAALTCQDTRESHRRSADVLAGKGSPAENAAVGVNVSLVMKLFEQSDLRENFARVQDAIVSGRPMQLVQELVAR